MTSPGLPASLLEAPTARQFYPAAAEVARSWHPDARVAALSAHWRSERGRWSADVTWMFRFYSPATRRVAVVIVEAAGLGLVEGLAARVGGGGGGRGTIVYIHPEADVVAQLRMLPGEGDRLAWTVTGIFGDQVSRLIIDGTTGEWIQD